MNNNRTSEMGNNLEVSWNTSVIRLIEERLKSQALVEYEKYIKLDNKKKIEYIQKNWGALYIGYDKKLLDNINAVLHPLLNKVVTEEISKEICENDFPRFNSGMHNIIEFRILLEKYANEIKHSSFEDESRLSLPYYLIIVESIFTIRINLIIYLLTKCNVKYYRTKTDGTKEYININHINKLNEESLYNKLTFLKENGFSVISDICDRKLRNSVAHMGFIVFTDGSVAYENEIVSTITKDELEKKIERLLNVCHCISKSIKQFYGQKYCFSREKKENVKNETKG